MSTVPKNSNNSLMADDLRLAFHSPRFVTKGIRTAPRRREPTTPFESPLRSLDGIEPSVLAAHAGDRLGVDLGYPEPLDVRALRAPVFAANDGEVSCAIVDGNGCAISLDHGGTWTTHYTGLSELAVIRCLPRLERRERVRAGEVIGYATRPRIGFELWKWTDDRGFVAVDPRVHLATSNRAPASTSAKEAA